MSKTFPLRAFGLVVVAAWSALAATACSTGAIGGEALASAGDPGSEIGAPSPDAAIAGDAPPDPRGGNDAAAVSDTATPTPTPGRLPLVAGLGISQIDFYQGVQTTVAKGGAKATHRAPIILGRDALVRVSVKPTAAYTAREITAIVSISGGGTTTTFRGTQTIAAASTDGQLSSTINVDVPGAAIAADAKYSVGLYTAVGQGPEGDTAGATYPAAGGMDPLQPQDTGSVFKVVIVPILYGADGSNRSPDVTAAQVELYRQAAFARYPARKVEVTVHAPYTYAGAIDASGNGWDTGLQAMIDLRQTDHAADDVYYYGAFDGADTFGQFCNSGCVAGLCTLVQDATDPTGRACIGLGFTGTDAADTMAHEVGHAHGRQHADCGGAANTDPAYPYAGASIGVWGYDLNDRSLKDPTQFTDMMGYCNPTWVSDYSFAALATRMGQVSAGKEILDPAGPKPYRFVNVAADGSLKWGRTTTLNRTPLAPKKVVQFLDAAGRIVNEVSGYSYSYDHLPGGYLLVAESVAPYQILRVVDGASIHSLARE